jgi:hypothetical protein
MRKLLGAFVLLCALSMTEAYASLWEANCSSCHNGKLAPTKETLLQRYSTPEEFLSAARKAVFAGKMPRGLGYPLVTKELYGRFPKASGTFSRIATVGKIEGEVLKLEKIPGFGKRKVMWWTVDVKTDEGTIKVWLVPVWRYPSINLRAGDKIRVTGFAPPYWQVSGIKGMMACLVENETTGTLLDLTFKPLCRRINVKGATSVQSSSTVLSSLSSFKRSQVLTGKVLSLSQQPGIGRKNVTWWVADLETPQGKIKVYLTPTFRFPTLDVAPGDSLQVTIFTPPRWKVLNLQNTYMACYFKNLSKGSEYRIRKRCP